MRVPPGAPGTAPAPPPGAAKPPAWARCLPRVEGPASRGTVPAFHSAASCPQVYPSDLKNLGSLAGIPWIFPLGLLNALPMLVEREIESTYLSLSDMLLSIPFFSHQNRITAHTFSVALQTQTGTCTPYALSPGIRDLLHFSASAAQNFLQAPGLHPSPAGLG